MTRKPHHDLLQSSSDGLVDLTNFDVYCYLKSVLRTPYRIVAEPSGNYFSEWCYCYRVLCHDEPLLCWQGDFRDLRPGELVQAAREFLESIGEDTKW